MKTELLTEKIPKQETDMVLYDLIKEGKMDDVFLFVKEKQYPVTPFVLHCLYSFNQTDCIEDLLKGDILYDPEIYYWLSAFWGLDKTAAFVCDYNLTKIITTCLPSAILVKYQQWDVLLKQGKADVLAKYNQWEILSQHHYYNFVVAADNGVDYLMEHRDVKGLRRFLNETEEDRLYRKTKRQQCVRFLAENLSDEELLSFGNPFNQNELQILFDCGRFEALRVCGYLKFLYFHGKFDNFTAENWKDLYIWYNVVNQDVQKHMIELLDLNALYRLGAYKWKDGKCYLQKLIESENWELLKKCRFYLLRHGFGKTWWKTFSIKSTK